MCFVLDLKLLNAVLVSATDVQSRTCEVNLVGENSSLILAFNSISFGVYVVVFLIKEYMFTWKDQRSHSFLNP